MQSPSEEMDRKRVDEGNLIKLAELDQVFENAEETISLLESNPRSLDPHQYRDLIETMWKMIYSSMIDTFFNAMDLLFHDSDTKETDTYQQIKPILDTWCSKTGTIDQQLFEEFRNDLRNFSTHYPNWSEDEWTLINWFEEKIRKQIFQRYIDRALNHSKRLEMLAALAEESKGKKANNYDQIISDHSDDELLDNLTLQDREPWRDSFERAKKYYCGLGNANIDYEAALKLFKQTAKMGSTFILYTIGQMYMAGRGCINDSKKALAFFKEGIHRGDGRCWAAMADLFFNEKHFENERKCWNKYFESKEFRDNLTYEDDPSQTRGLISSSYVLSRVRMAQEIENREILRSIKDELMEIFLSLLAIAKEREHQLMISFYQKVLEEVQKL
jgi:hypothetical protein